MFDLLLLSNPFATTTSASSPLNLSVMRSFGTSLFPAGNAIENCWKSASGQSGLFAQEDLSAICQNVSVLTFDAKKAAQAPSCFSFVAAFDAAVDRFTILCKKAQGVSRSQFIGRPSPPGSVKRPTCMASSPGSTKHGRLIVGLCDWACREPEAVSCVQHSPRAS